MLLRLYKSPQWLAAYLAVAAAAVPCCSAQVPPVDLLPLPLHRCCQAAAAAHPRQQPQACPQQTGGPPPPHPQSHAGHLPQPGGCGGFVVSGHEVSEWVLMLVGEWVVGAWVKCSASQEGRDSRCIGLSPA